MRRLERRQNPLEPRELLKGLQRVFVRHVRVLGAAERAEPRVLGADRGVVEPRRDRMRELDVPVLVLQDERARSLQHAGAPAGEARRVAPAGDLVAAGFDADQTHGAVVDERVEDADRVAAAADARDDRRREHGGELEKLRARLASDHGLEFADHQRIRMRPEHRSEQVVRVADVGHPVAHRLVDRVLERAAAGVHAANLRAEQAHAEDVQRLAIHVLGAHEDVALEAEQRARRGRRDAVLPRARLGDDAALAHADGEQRLPERVVDLVRACVREVLALEEDPRAAERGGQPRRFVDRRRPPDVVLQQTIELGVEGFIVAHGEVRALELLDRVDERLGDVASAELAEVAARVRIAS